jgi:hypothetical protein
VVSLTTERQNTQVTNMKTSDNGGLLRLSNQTAK